jgi:hypothetical protein
MLARVERRKWWRSRGDRFFLLRQAGDLLAQGCALRRCAGGSAQAVMVAARCGFSLRLAVLVQARWRESRWLIRLVVLAAMFWLSFCGLSFFFAARRTRAHVVRGGRSSIFVSRASFGEGAGRLCQCLLGAVFSAACDTTRLDGARGEEVVRDFQCLAFFSLMSDRLSARTGKPLCSSEQNRLRLR